MLLQAICHGEGIPMFKEEAEFFFMEHYNDVVNVVNDHIEEFNELYSSLNDDSVNYTKFMVDHLTPFVEAVQKENWFCKFRLDEDCNIEGYIPGFENSRLWITLQEVES